MLDGQVRLPEPLGEENGEPFPRRDVVRILPQPFHALISARRGFQQIRLGSWLRPRFGQVIAQGIRRFTVEAPVDHAVGTSKTLRSLARIAGAAPYRDGSYVRRVLAREQASRILDKVTSMKAKDRAKLP